MRETATRHLYEIEDGDFGPDGTLSFPGWIQCSFETEDGQAVMPSSLRTSGGRTEASFASRPKLMAVHPQMAGPKGERGEPSDSSPSAVAAAAWSWRTPSDAMGDKPADRPQEGQSEEADQNLTRTDPTMVRAETCGRTSWRADGGPVERAVLPARRDGEIAVSASAAMRPVAVRAEAFDSSGKRTASLEGRRRKDGWEGGFSAAPDADGNWRMACVLPNSVAIHALENPGLTHMWRMRYASSEDSDGSPIWRRWSEPVAFSVNSPPAPPTGLEVSARR